MQPEMRSAACKAECARPAGDMNCSRSPMQQTRKHKKLEACVAAATRMNIWLLSQLFENTHRMASASCTPTQLQCCFSTSPKAVTAVQLSQLYTGSVLYALCRQDKPALIHTKLDACIPARIRQFCWHCSQQLYTPYYKPDCRCFMPAAKVQQTSIAELCLSMLKLHNTHPLTPRASTPVITTCKGQHVTPSTPCGRYAPVITRSFCSHMSWSIASP